ncbi:AMP-binding protein [Slackia heliotrinireducens]|uniref:AMP-binding protein n=1 Tax=Slackia heliotrinireducens TaxID=84110 RepID=UPI003315B779
MSLYQKYCHEEVDEQGRLVRFELDCPEGFNFGYDVVDVMAEEDPDKTAMVWCNAAGEERVFSFADVREHSNRIANVFQAAGLSRGMKVMLVLKRHYDYWFTLVALHKLGITAIPVTHMLTTDDYAYRLRAASVDAVVCTSEGDVPEHVLEAARQTGSTCALWVARGDVPGFRCLENDAAHASTTLDRVPTSLDDVMLLYFTSGSTGYPKGVMHDFSYPLAHIFTARHWQKAREGGLHFTVAETGWAKAAWGKIYGQWLVGSAVMIYDFDSFDPKLLCGIINTYGVTSFCAPPTVYRYLARKGIPAMPSLQQATTAGETLSSEVFEAFRNKVGIPLREGYGQTETVLLAGNFDEADAVAGSLGTSNPLFDVQLRGEDGRPVAVGEVGEVVVVPREGQRMIGLLTGFLHDDERYCSVWKDGVYHTGDAAWQDDTGLFWFFGRFDDIIKTSGYRVGPYEVESVLSKHPAVAECSVIGVADKFRGQSIKAFVVLGESYRPSFELELAIREAVNSQLAEYKWIRHVEFVDKLPKTISGKIRKNVLRDRSDTARHG